MTPTPAIAAQRAAETLPVGPFGVLLADPPWRHVVYSAKGEGRSASRHYGTMTLEAIKGLPVAEIAGDDCHLFLWTTRTHLPASFDVMVAWGFRYSSVAFDWIKLNKRAPRLFIDQKSFFMGMGHTTRANAEYCLLGRRGSPKRLSKSIRSLIVSPLREHSRKPDEAIERIEAYAPGPRLEMFARQRREGWSTWGNQTDHFEEIAA